MPGGLSLLGVRVAMVDMENVTLRRHWWHVMSLKLRARFDAP